MKLLFSTVLAFATLASAADVKLGRPFKIGNPLTVGQVMDQAAEHVGKTVQVKGKVTEVCQSMGCWMSLTDDAGHLLRVQVSHDGDIVFPKSAIGKTAVAEGKLGREELTQEEAMAAAKHEAEESGRKFDPAIVKSGKVAYEIAGTGAVIYN